MDIREKNRYIPTIIYQESLSAVKGVHCHKKLKYMKLQNLKLRYIQINLCNA